MTSALRILMLDDEWDAVSPLVHDLRQTGHAVTYAKDLSAALQSLNQTPHDWVFIDVMLDCTIPDELKSSYALLNTGVHNEGQALGMHLWAKRKEARADGSGWPGYAYLSNSSIETLSKAKESTSQEFGGSPERFFLSKYRIAGGQICGVLTTCRDEWKKLP